MPAGHATACAADREPPRQPPLARIRKCCWQDRERLLLVSLLLTGLGLAPVLRSSKRAQHATLYSHRAFLRASLSPPHLCPLTIIARTLTTQALPG